MKENHDLFLEDLLRDQQKIADQGFTQRTLKSLPKNYRPHILTASLCLSSLMTFIILYQQSTFMSSLYSSNPFVMVTLAIGLLFTLGVVFFAANDEIAL
ncbi:MAG: hypothetical protein VXV96_04305 [Bdellovibrionota bacterium]|nr:hypothetical protein [Bdellovibrionota bacterium]